MGVIIGSHPHPPKEKQQHKPPPKNPNRTTPSTPQRNPEKQTSREMLSLIYMEKDTARRMSDQMREEM